MRLVEVFSGCGGLSSGLVEAGLTIKELLDHDKDSCATLCLNHSGTLVHQASVFDFHLERDCCDLLAGGVPCQSFSLAGKQKGLLDPRGNMFKEFTRLVEEASPSVFLVENVVGLVLHQKGRTLEGIIDNFEKLGYHVKWKVLNAVDYQVAQKRRRIFIVGYKKTEFDFEDYSFPEKVIGILTLKDILGGVPESAGTSYSTTKKSFLEKIPSGGCWTSLSPHEQKTYLGGSFTSGGGKRGFARRLAWNEPCLTLTTSPSQKQTERCHPDETRPFTTREYARIQSFPDTYQFHGSISSIYKQIGNAVPIKLAYHVGLSLKILFSKKKVYSSATAIS